MLRDAAAKTNNYDWVTSASALAGDGSSHGIIHECLILERKTVQQL